MNSPQLTQKVAEKILSIIDQQEAESESNGNEVGSKYYLQLADLYHFDKDFINEAAILKRFARFGTAANDDLVEIYDRIERVSRLNEFKIRTPKKSPELALVADIDEDDHISISTSDAISKRVNKSLIPFAEKNHKVLTICAAYTGRTDDDEVVELALLLSEIIPQDERIETIESFVGIRKTTKAVPNKTKMQFGLNQIDYRISPFEKSKILELFNSADFVISHNDADIERKLIAILIPEVAEKPWYSSQKDIPWGALGYETKSLTQLSKAHGEKAARTSLDRAAAIAKLVNKLEPCGQQTYLERLYNMQPMKAFEWNSKLKRRSRQLNRSVWLKPLLWITGLALVATAGWFAFSSFLA